MIFGGGGGIENCSGVPATLNEMLLQTHGGVARVFPVWPRHRDARFGRLRAPGAFLVSSTLRSGEVEKVEVESERGREWVIRNPWVGKPVRLQREGRESERLMGEVLRIPTRTGEKLLLLPEK